MTRRFAGLAEADAFLGPELDRPEVARTLELGGGATLDVRVAELGGGAFNNVYTVRWRGARAGIEVRGPGALESPYACGRRMAAQGRPGVVASGGFFFLADDTREGPRTRCLNLVVDRGRVLSLPVVGQEALVCRAGALEVVHVPAVGTLRLNGRTLRWAGSRAGVEADCVVFGNADLRVEHRADPRTGKYRHFDGASRWTPAAPRGWVDVGLSRGADGVFRGVARGAGGLDIFEYDGVLRCRGEVLGAHEDILDVLTIGPLVVGEGALEGAISVGPSLLDRALERHPLHREPSLGSFPLLGGRRGWCTSPTRRGGTI